MSPEVLRAMQAIAQSLMASRPNEARQIQQWVQAGGNYALPATVLTVALPLAPTVGVPASAIMAAMRTVQGAGGTYQATRATDQGQMSGPPTSYQTAGAGSGMQPPANPQGPGTVGNETTPQSVGLNPAASGGGVRDNTSPGYPGNAPAPVATTSGGVRDNNSPGYPGNAPAPPPGPPAAGGGGSAGNPGGFAAGFGDFLSGNDDGLIRFAMQAAGFNPDIVTPASKIAAQKLAALVKSRRAAFAAGNPDQNVGGLPQDIASFAKEYTTPGTDFYGNARKYAQGVLGGGMQDLLNGVADQSGRFGQYQALIPMLYGGSNPLIQQSVSDQLGNIYDKWNLESAMDPTNAGKADILQFIRNMPNLSPVLRSIFGAQR